jgi:hypothetical protein
VPFYWQLRIKHGADHSPREAVATAFAVLTEQTPSD